MKVMIVKTNNTVRGVEIITKGYNEVTWADLKKLTTGNIDTVYLDRISRLAYLYVMYVDKSTPDRPLNKLATLLLNDPTKVVRGDVIVTRIEHLGAGAKILALENDEIDKIAKKLSTYSGSPIQVLK